LNAVAVVAELCMLYPGWTVDYVLSLPAKTFFAMRRSGFKTKRMWNSAMFAELVVIARSPEMEPNAAQRLFEFYRSSADDSGLERVDKRGMDPTDPRVQQMLAANFAYAKKVMGY
jgi:hypothetical protein